MCHTIQLADATIEQEAKILRQAFCEHSRNRVHACRFQCVNSEQPRTRISNYSPDRIHVCSRKNVLDKRIRGYGITDLGSRIVRMLMHQTFRGADQHVWEISPPCSIKIPPDFAQVHAYIIRQPHQVAIRE